MIYLNGFKWSEHSDLIIKIKSSMPTWETLVECEHVNVHESWEYNQYSALNCQLHRSSEEPQDMDINHDMYHLVVNLDWNHFRLQKTQSAFHAFLRSSILDQYLASNFTHEYVISH